MQKEVSECSFAEDQSLGFKVLKVLAIVLSVFHIYTACAGLLVAPMQRGIHLFLSLALLFGTSKTGGSTKQYKAFNILTYILLITVSVYTLTVATPENLAERALVGIGTTDIVVGAIIILLLLEATRRANKALCILVVVFIAYTLFGHYIPGLMGHREYGLKAMIEHQVFTTEGIWGLPLGVSANYVAIFIIFGSFLEASGIGKRMIDFAYALTGKTRSGPALTAVTSSALLGTVTGTGVANVLTTGLFTIPLMKKMGYKPHFAGAVEATASIGGQFLPPVMGAGAFLIAEILGIPYISVAKAALIPAILYFLAAGISCHLEACQLGIEPTREGIPPVRQAIVNGIWSLAPIFVLIYFLAVLKWSPFKSAFYAMISIFALAGIDFLFSKKFALTPKRILLALEKGGKSVVNVASVCAAAGIIVGTTTQTGLGLKLSMFIVELSGGITPVALFLTMCLCIVLGMGLPTAAAYVITATLMAPPLIHMGLMPIAVHLFIFYFAIISGLTPPVAISAYAAAGIAEADELKTALTATRLAITAYIVPYMFIAGPGLLLEGPVLTSIINCITASVGVVLLAIALQGWLKVRLSWWQRIMCLSGALLLMYYSTATDIIGIALAISFFLINRIESRKQQQVAVQSLEG